MDRVQILWIGRFYKGKNDGIKPHSHPFYHMIYVASGFLQLTAGTQSYELEQGSCILIPKGVKHAYSNPRDCLTENLEIKFTLPVASMDSTFTQYGPLVSDSPLVGMLYRQIVQEYSDLGSLADDAAAAYLQALLKAMTESRRYAKRHAFRYIDAAEYSPLSQKIIQYLESHFSGDVSLDKLAAAMDYNKSYMCTAFKKDTQITINDCLNMIRIRRAAELIAYSDNDLTQIAAICGFASVSHFNRVFLKYVGNTPGQCRKAYPQDITIQPDLRFLDAPERQNRFMYSVLAQKRISPEMILAFEKGELEHQE